MTMLEDLAEVVGSGDAIDAAMQESGDRRTPESE